MEAEVLALKWNNHQSIFYHIICGLRTKSNYTDVTLACEGKFYPVHKLVLSTCSEYFSEIFTRTPCKNPVVVLKDIQCKDLEFLLDYMYIGEVNVRQNELSSLLKAAECLKVKGLAVREDDTSQADSPKRHGGRDKHDLSSPPAKKRRAEECRNKASDAASDFGQENSCGNHLEESSSDIPIFAGEQHGEPPLSHNGSDQDISGEAENEIQPIKIEQDLDYEGSGSFKPNQSTIPTNYDSDQYLAEEENRIPKAENSDEVLDDTVMGVNFNELLQSSLKSDEFGEPHSSVHSQVNLEQQWDGSGVGRSLSSHSLPSSAAPHNPLTHHQQQKTNACGELCCPICGKASSRRDNLERHIRSHLGDKPFQCPFCNFRSQLKWNMKSHIERRHHQRQQQSQHEQQQNHQNSHQQQHQGVPPWRWNASL
ncbi:longitudinals lacking protein, isoforms A/B/D/L-like isoform X2 [Macrobrachium nipponense]|uniref:longitudinals lacking protein, isoforms A/B/D/L-like isoform X2 n=1 Tax=Macrobrachium nipponense TaxID=159736 RepID=UPI0030C893FD